MPVTRTVSIREFRENMTKYLREAQEKNVHFVVMRHAVPVAHITPIDNNDSSLEALIAKVEEARREAAEGKVYSAEQVLAMIDRHASPVHANGRKRSRKASARSGA